MAKAKKKMSGEARLRLKEARKHRDEQIKRARDIRDTRYAAAAKEFKKVKDAAQKVCLEREKKILQDDKRRVGDGNDSTQSVEGTQGVQSIASAQT